MPQVIDVLVKDEEEACKVANKYLLFFCEPSAPNAGCFDQEPLRWAIPENRKRVYDIRKVITTLCDKDSVLELRRGYGGIVTCLCRLGGNAVGLLANDPLANGGAIGGDCALKASRFMKLCDAFGVPIVTLVDTPGFLVGPVNELDAPIRKTSNMFVTASSLTVPVFSVILRKAYGLGAMAMTGGSFQKPQLIVSWPLGELGPMGLEGAVKLGILQLSFFGVDDSLMTRNFLPTGFSKQLTSVKSEKDRKQLEQRLIRSAYENGSCLNAASLFEVDNVIDPAETRKVLITSIECRVPVVRLPSHKMRHSIPTW